MVNTRLFYTNITVREVPDWQRPAQHCFSRDLLVQVREVGHHEAEEEHGEEEYQRQTEARPEVGLRLCTALSHHCRLIPNLTRFSLLLPDGYSLSHLQTHLNLLM